MKSTKQLRLVDEALLVNGPGVGLRIDVRTGVRSVIYSLPGEAPVEYTLFPFKWDRGTRRSDPAGAYRIGYTGARPGDDVITAAIEKNSFEPYFEWFPQRGG